MAHIRSAGAPRVVAVARRGGHGIGKGLVAEVELVAGVGVAGDAHAGGTVQHRSRVRRDTAQPNLRQVHLIGAELLDELAGAGMAVTPGEMGENITTRDLDLPGLATGTLLQLGDEAIVSVTGLRNPCAQLDELHDGLKAAVLGRDAEGALVRRAGVMAVVVAGGTVRAGHPLRVTAPQLPAPPLSPV